MISLHFTCFDFMKNTLVPKKFFAHLFAFDESRYVFTSLTCKLRNLSTSQYPMLLNKIVQYVPGTHTV